MLVIYNIAITFASVAAGDVTDSYTQSAGDVMTSLSLWRHAAARTHRLTERQTDSEWKHHLRQSLRSLDGDIDTEKADEYDQQ